MMPYYSISISFFCSSISIINTHQSMKKKLLKNGLHFKITYMDDFLIKLAIMRILMD